MFDIVNLTGHDIVIVDGYGYEIKTLHPHEKEEPIRAEVESNYLGTIDGVPYKDTKFSLALTKNKMTRLANKYDGIIVSKISAEALIRNGYKGKIFVPGRKYLDHGEIVGVRELCLY